MVVPSAFDIGYGGVWVPLGSAGSVFLIGFWLSALLGIGASIIAWLKGSRWPLLAVMAIVALALLPSAMLLSSCMQGDCL